MKKVAILLHLHQPSIQEEKTMREIAKSSFLPLIKTIKDKSKLNLSLSISLSLLEQMDALGYSDWLKDIKYLVEDGRIELVGTAAYHPLLTEIPEVVVQSQVILNEYGLGYYFGRTSGFEGEEAVLIKDLNGFYSPELVVNSNLNRLLDDFGYEWMVVNPVSIEKRGNSKVLQVENSGCAVVVIDKEISDEVAVYKEFNIKPLIKKLEKNQNLVLAFRGEELGYKNEEGIYLLSRLVDSLSKKNTQFVTVSQFVDEEFSESQVEEIDEIKDSTQSVLSEEGLNEEQQELKEIHDILIKELTKIIKNSGSNYGLPPNAPIWKLKELPDEIELELELSRVLDSEPFLTTADTITIKKYLEKYTELKNNLT